MEHWYRLPISITGIDYRLFDIVFRLSVIWEHRYRLPISIIGYGTLVSIFNYRLYGTPVSITGIDYRHRLSVVGFLLSVTDFRFLAHGEIGGVHRGFR